MAVNGVEASSNCIVISCYVLLMWLQTFLCRLDMKFAAVDNICCRSDVDEDNAEHEKFAITLRDQLIRLMEDKVAEMSSDDMFLPKLKLQETVLQFRQMYGARPMNLVRTIKNCLSTEMKLVQDADSVR